MGQEYVVRNRVQTRKIQNMLAKCFQYIKEMVGHVLVEKGLGLLIIALLLGRASILNELTPFALPFFAAVYMVKREHAILAFWGLLVGSFFLSLAKALFVFLLLIGFLIGIQAIQRLSKRPLKIVPYFLFLLSSSFSILLSYIVNNFSQNYYEWLLAVVEASLASVLVFIFMQSLPLLSIRKRKKALKTEEIISLMIMLATIMTGAIGWYMYDISVANVLANYLVLLFSYAAGAAIGATTGVITGLIFCLASISSFVQMGLLAFSGLASGLLREGKKLGVGIGFILATVLIGLTMNEMQLVDLVYEAVIAVFLLLLTPLSLVTKIAQHIPGTAEHIEDQQRYTRKLRDLTAKKVERFSTVFQALANSFEQPETRNEEERLQQEYDLFLSRVTEKTCQTCFKRNQCWGDRFDETYELMCDAMRGMDAETGALSPLVSRRLKQHCTKAEKVQVAMQKELALLQTSNYLKAQIYESRKLVAEQLQGVSEVMSDFAKEMKREKENYLRQEKAILDVLQEFGIEIDQVEIYSLEQGNIDLDVMLVNDEGYGECEKIIAPLLSDVLNETVVVQSKEYERKGGVECFVRIRSAKVYTVETGVAHAAKGGGFLSGDSYLITEISPSKHAIAISDGMGNGERAHYESNDTLQLLQKILQSGIEETIAIKSINSILSLRTTDEIFSTLDLAIIDLHDAMVTFLKVGSTPSYIKRGKQIIKIETGNLPIGILPEFDVDVVTRQLKAGDLLIMMSDGIFEGPKHVENYDQWLRRKLRELHTDEPQAVADLIMEEVIRTCEGEIADDMTVTAIKINHHTPEWSTIPFQQMKKIV